MTKKVIDSTKLARMKSRLIKMVGDNQKSQALSDNKMVQEIAKMIQEEAKKCF